MKCAGPLHSQPKTHPAQHVYGWSVSDWPPAWLCTATAFRPPRHRARSCNPWHWPCTASRTQLTACAGPQSPPATVHRLCCECCSPLGKLTKLGRRDDRHGALRLIPDTPHGAWPRACVCFCRGCLNKPVYTSATRSSARSHLPRRLPTCPRSLRRGASGCRASLTRSKALPASTLSSQSATAQTAPRSDSSASQAHVGHSPGSARSWFNGVASNKE